MIEFIMQYWLEVIFGIVVAGVGAVFVSLRSKLKKQIEKEKALEKGVCSLLRAEMIRSGEKYIQKRYCNIYAKDTFDKAYKAYHDLGGNGTMTELHEQVMNLPAQEQEKNKCSERED